MHPIGSVFWLRCCVYGEWPYRYTVRVTCDVELLEWAQRGSIEHMSEPSWPREVQQPGTPRWEASAGRWLLQHVPGEWRSDPKRMRLYYATPLLLARGAWYLIGGYIEGQRNAMAKARVECADEVEPPQLEELMAAYKAEIGRLTQLQQQVWTVGQALRGVRAPV